jgi:hypothetical protein
MKRKPVIFLSSVFVGLKNLRDDIYKIITEEYGWTCSEYQNNEEKWIGSPINVSSSKVDEADLFIGLFWQRAGSTGIENTPITEIEFYKACNKQIPIKIFEINTPRMRREFTLELFLEDIKDPDTGQIIKFCTNFTDLVESLRRFLDYFGSLWEKGEEKKARPQAFLFELIRKYRDSLIDLNPTRISVPPAYLVKSLNEDIATANYN